MPILRRKKDGGHYIVGPPHGGANTICVWQVLPEGLAYLRGRGIREEGRVSYQDLQDLKQKSWIWSGDGGPGESDLARRFDVDLLDRLADWSDMGGASGLEWGLAHFDRIFPDSFLNWLRTLADGGRLAEFDGMSRGDFWGLARPRLKSLASPLHAGSVEFYDDNGRLLWRLAEVVGRVAWQVETDGDAPPATWNDDFKVLARLHERLRHSTPTVPPIKRMPRHKADDPRTRPYIWWDVDGQRVVGVLPGRVLEGGLSIAWSMPDTDLPGPPVYPVPEGARVEETQTDPLGPSCQYKFTTIVRPEGAAAVVDYPLPAGYRPFVLFSAEGRLLPCGQCESYAPGEYLALALCDLAGDVPGRQGVRVVERVDYEPVLWHGWRGFRLELAEGADVAPYRMAGGGRARWEAEETPAYRVVFENTRPIWVGMWPRIEISPRGFFGDGLIEVEQDSDRSRHVIRLGSDVSAVSIEGRDMLDLEASAPLRNVYGSIRLACRLAALPDQPPLTLSLIRVRPIDLEYVEDPDVRRRDRVAAVQVTTEQAVAAGPGTRLEDLSGSIVARAMTPDEAPSVRLLLPDSGAELRIRVPRTRVRFLSTRRPSEGWREPGELEIRLAEIGIEDRLRVELHLGAELERGRPLCRLVGGSEVASGEPSPLPGTFDIPLHRWLDRLGPEAVGMVQVRGRHRWIDLVRLTGRPMEAPHSPVGGLEAAPASVAVGEGPALVFELGQAAAREDWEQTARSVVACLDRVEANGVSPAERDWLLVAVARASTHLGDEGEALRALDILDGRDDLYEPWVLRRVLELRRGEVPRQEIWRRAEAVKELPAEFPLKWIVAAEHYVHFADGPGEGYWISCRRLIESIAWPAGLAGEGSIWTTDRKEATLLHALATFRIGKVPAVPDGVPTAGQWRWLTALSFAAERVTSPGVRPAGGRAVPAADLPRPPLCPARDADLVRVILHQAAGRASASAGLLERFRSVTPEEFFAIDLLRFRQLRLEGRFAEAKNLFRSCLNWARGHDHAVLLRILMDEFD